MDAYDEGSDARHGPDRPDGSAPPPPAEPARPEATADRRVPRDPEAVCGDGDVPEAGAGDRVPRGSEAVCGDGDFPEAGNGDRVPRDPAAVTGDGDVPEAGAGDRAPRDPEAVTGDGLPEPGDGGSGPGGPRAGEAGRLSEDREAGAEGGVLDASGAGAAGRVSGPDAGQPGRGPGAPDRIGAPAGAGDEAWPPPAGPAGEGGALPDDRTGLAALSLPYRIAAATALAFVMVAACVHLGTVFLHVAPSNTATRQHGRAVEEWIYPEFEQNWKLFAPNPLQQNIAVQVRAEVRTADGGHRTTGWYDLSAQDGEAIDGNLLPSHTQQNELRRAWDFFLASHDGENRPTGLRGDLSERYLRRIVVLRLDRERVKADSGLVERVQVRSRTTNVPPPDWSVEQVSDKPVFRVLPWWRVPSGAGASA